MKNLPILLFSSLLFILSCTEDKIDKDPDYYSPIRALLKKEEAFLAKKNPQVLKISVFDTKYDSIVIGDIRWDQELTLFYALDILKPSLKGIYKIEADTLKGLLIEKYSKADKSTHPVEQMQLVKNAKGIITRISATEHRENPFFSTNTNYRLDFDTTNGQIRNYELSAIKKFLWGKTDTYFIRTYILN